MSSQNKRSANQLDYCEQCDYTTRTEDPDSRPVVYLCIRHAAMGRLIRAYQRKDRIKTEEINLLVKENRALLYEIKKLKEWDV